MRIDTVRSARRMSLSRIVGIIGLVIVLLAIANVVAVIAAAQSTDRADRLTNDTLQPARIAVERLRSAMIDQETGMRGYVLTTNREFLEPYDSGIGEADEAVEVLARVVADIPEVQRSLDEVLRARDSWRSEAAQVEIALVDSGAQEDALQFVASGQGKVRFDEVRARIDDLESKIVDRIVGERGRADRQASRLRQLSVATAALLALIVIAALAALRSGFVPAVGQLAHQLDRVAEGDLNRPIEPGGTQELVSIASSAEVMRRRLLTSVDRRVESRLVLAQEEQRRRIAEGVHDDSLQSLTVVMMGLTRLRRNVPSDRTDDVRTLELELAHAASRLRELLFELHPPGLESGRVGVAVGQLIDRIVSPTSLEVFRLYDPQLQCEPIVAITGYRVIREAVTNCVRHAQASRLTVEIEASDDGYRLMVSDDGIGATPERIMQRSAGHLGLAAVLDVVEAVGGRFEVTTDPGHGTKIGAWIPSDALTDALAGAPSRDGPSETA